MNKILIHPAARQDQARIATLEQATGMRVVGRKTPHPRLVTRQVYKMLFNAAKQRAARRKQAAANHHPGSESA